LLFGAGTGSFLPLLTPAFPFLTPGYASLTAKNARKVTNLYSCNSFNLRFYSSPADAFLLTYNWMIKKELIKIT